MLLRILPPRQLWHRCYQYRWYRWLFEEFHECGHMHRACKVRYCHLNEHTFVTEFVIGFAIHGQIGIFDSPNANYLGQGFDIVIDIVGTFRDIVFGNADDFFQLIVETDGIPQASGEFIAIFSLHQSKWHMFQGYIFVVFDFLCGSKDHLKMLRLCKAVQSRLIYPSKKIALAPSFSTANP